MFGNSIFSLSRYQSLLVVIIGSIVCGALQCHAKNSSNHQQSSSVSIVNSNSDTGSVPATVKLSSSSALNVVVSGQDALNKRNVKSVDLTQSASAKSYDPPPEFYRGPGSVTSSAAATTASATSSSTLGNHRDSSTADFISKPISFPNDRHSLSDSFNNWQKLKATGSVGLGHYGLQDRISVGHHYGSGTSGHHTGESGSYTSSHDAPYHYEGRPYSNGHADYIPSSSHYPGGGGSGGYYANAGPGSDDGIPFDVYGKDHYGGGPGGEYSSYPGFGDAHNSPVHKGSNDWSNKALLAKSFLIPLASATVLGIAAALVSNPLLLQLGTVSGVGSSVVGRRRKRRDLHGRSARAGTTTMANAPASSQSVEEYENLRMPEATTIAYRAVEYAARR